MVFPIVPQPSVIRSGPGTFEVTASTRIVVDNDGDAGEADAAASALVDAVAQRTGLRLQVAKEAADGDIFLHHRRADDERYTLEIGDTAHVEGSAAGLFYGVQTVRQLHTATEYGWTLPRMIIIDEPRYAYRGVMLDVARTFLDVAAVKGYIDRASSLKFNRLHLHLTDDQGWRIQIDSRPLLTELGATTSTLGRPGGFYTKEDFREIVAYAAARHMVVVPEIDLPGHTHAIGVAYPEIVEAPVMNDVLVEQARELDQPLPVAGEPYLGWGVGHSSVRIHDEVTWAFLGDVLTELAELTPGPYLHVGGDEALGTPPDDFNAFAERITALVVELGKTPMVWHETGSAVVANGTIGQYWGGIVPTDDQAAQALRFVECGGSVVMSPSDVSYLDQKYDADFPVGLDWAALIDLETAYTWEPSTIVPGLGDDAIAGVEAPLWTETVASLVELDQLFFPRAAALAEVAWSAAGSRDWESFRERVGALAPVWDAAGWGGYRPAEITWSRS
ncbi:family 20 glycosylhydrolase [Microbacterium sp.]|uniref:family 20 glycosylhydrolase n=1 Tax=Microbacterium sp. TaxID=51671 RepID=UPI00262A2BC8|nr:family 20 glycosylhydrolase [Microbacterium sp.]